MNVAVDRQLTASQIRNAIDMFFKSMAYLSSEASEEGSRYTVQRAYGVAPTYAWREFKAQGTSSLEQPRANLAISRILPMAVMGQPSAFEVCHCGRLGR